jgi:hypothetical protein
MSTLLRDPPEQVERPTPHPLPARHHPWRHFWRHFLEMFVVMWVGMVAFAFLFIVILNAFFADNEVTWKEALRDYPGHALLALAVGMSLPMIPWMRFRGHSRRSAYEIAHTNGSMGLVPVGFRPIYSDCFASNRSCSWTRDLSPFLPTGRKRRVLGR